jgi:hypothetical protein
MFETILELIKGTDSIEAVEPKLKAAGLHTKFQSAHILDVIYLGHRYTVIQLWGNKIILRGVDSDGFPKETVTHAGL